MRDIRFRVWHKPDQTMHPYLKVKFGKSINVTFEGKFKDVDQVTTKTVPLKDIEIMQFTGLTDGKGTEIYEGDLLQNPLMSGLWEVKFQAGMFIADLLPGSERMGLTPPAAEPLYRVNESLEIVGNRFANPELLPAT